MLPTKWGNCGWKFIHSITLNYPENPTNDDKDNYVNFFYSLIYILPCDSCGNNLKNHYKKLPLDEKSLTNRYTLVKWGIDLHNIVNQSIGKKTLSYELAMSAINNMFSSSNINNNHTQRESSPKQKSKNNDSSLSNFFLLLICIFLVVVILFILLGVI
jgi:hypothetical protein